MTFYKVTMVIGVNEGHPRNWVPEAIWENLKGDEDLHEIDYEELVDYDPEVV